MKLQYLKAFFFQNNLFNGASLEPLPRGAPRIFSTPLDHVETMLGYKVDIGWIIILFFIYLNAFRVEILEESTCKRNFMSGT